MDILEPLTSWILEITLSCYDLDQNLQFANFDLFFLILKKGVKILKVLKIVVKIFDLKGH